MKLSLSTSIIWCINQHFIKVSYTIIMHYFGGQLFNPLHLCRAGKQILNCQNVDHCGPWCILTVQDDHHFHSAIQCTSSQRFNREHVFIFGSFPIKSYTNQRLIFPLSSNAFYSKLIPTVNTFSFAICIIPELRMETTLQGAEES